MDQNNQNTAERSISGVKKTLKQARLSLALRQNISRRKSASSADKKSES